MISINPDRIKAAINEHQIAVDVDNSEIKKALEELIKKYYNKVNNDERVYLDKLSVAIKAINIITAEMAVLETIKSSVGLLPIFQKKIIESYIDTKGKRRKRTTNLAKLLESCFDYTKKRGGFYPLFFKSIGINTCVYCNSQPVLVIERATYSSYNGKKNGSQLVAKFQVDHYIPQKKYPYLATSLYNLYPVCGPCNNAKKETSVKFELYSNSYKSSVYSFSLDPISKANYLLAYEKEKLKIHFHDPYKPDANKVSKGSFEDTFGISGIYETQKDVAEEIILKALIYNSSYKKMLKDAFKGTITDQSFAGRLLLGNYTEPEEIHKRPLAKFMQDIAIDVNLIKRK